MEQKKLGFGLMRLPLTDPEDPTSIAIQEVNDMVDTFLERGFTYFDTAYFYHEYTSEDALRESLIKRHPRNTFTVATKLPLTLVKAPEDLPRFFNEQLEKTGAGYFDYYLLHNLNTSNYKVAKRHDAFTFIAQKKAEGLIKKIGFSFHDRAELLDEILSTHPEMEFVQLQINYLDWENESIQSKKCLEIATKHNKPVIVMEPVKGGMLADVPPSVEKLFKAHHPDMSVPSWAIRYAASCPNVFMVLSGMSNMAQLRDNTSYMQNFKPLDADELAVVAQAVSAIQADIAVPCTACLYCVEGCPKNIAIPKYFALYNSKQQLKGKRSPILGVYYKNFAKVYGKASDCIACGKCEKSCPQHLPIIQHLSEIVAAFE